MDVTHPQLVAALVKPPENIIATLSQYTADLWHGATGVAGECGELLEGLMIVISAKQEGPQQGRDNVIEESGDIYFYTEQLVQRTGIEIDWDGIAVFARNQHLGPDAMLEYGALVAVFGSQVLDTVKKAAVYNKELDTALLTTQLHQMLRYVLTIGYMFGVERTECLAANIAKLKVRYEGLAYTDKAAQLRADKVPERKFFGKEPIQEAVPLTDEQAIDRYKRGIPLPPGIVVAKNPERIGAYEVVREK